MSTPSYQDYSEIFAFYMAARQTYIEPVFGMPVDDPAVSLFRATIAKLTDTRIDDLKQAASPAQKIALAPQNFPRPYTVWNGLRSPFITRRPVLTDIWQQTVAPHATEATMQDNRQTVTNLVTREAAFAEVSMGNLQQILKVLPKKDLNRGTAPGSPFVLSHGVVCEHQKRCKPMFENAGQALVQCLGGDYEADVMRHSTAIALGDSGYGEYFRPLTRGKWVPGRNWD